MADHYYSEGGVTIFHGNAEDLIPTVGRVGLVLTSPPYNLSSGGRRVRGSEFNQLDGGYATYNDDLPPGVYGAWQRDVLGKCWDALIDDGAIFYNHKPVLRDGVCKLPFEYAPPHLILRQVVTWDRMSGFTRTHSYYVPRYEWIMVYAKLPWRTTTLNVDDLWPIPFETHSDHPAPFPLALANRVMATTAADVVLDPFAGSGTTLLAAKLSGRQAIGIELDERYCEMAAKRLSQEVLAFDAPAAAEQLSLTQ